MVLHKEQDVLSKGIYDNFSLLHLYFNIIRYVKNKISVRLNKF